MRRLNLGLVQINTILFNKEHNFEQSIKQVSILTDQGADIICLPELFVSGYEAEALADNTGYFIESADGKIVKSLQCIAKTKEVIIIAGIGLTGENGQIRNSAIIIDNNGTIAGIEAKRHLFGREKDIFIADDSPYKVYETQYGKVGVIICYDNNFPEPARILALKGAELIVVLCAWQVQDKEIYELMLKAHACENTIFMAACNMLEKTDKIFLF